METLPKLWYKLSSPSPQPVVFKVINQHLSRSNNEIRSLSLFPTIEIVSSFAAQLSRLSSANKSLTDDGQTEMTASLCLPNKSCRLPIKSIHAAIIVIVSYDMYEINNNAALSQPL